MGQRRVLTRQGSHDLRARSRFCEYSQELAVIAKAAAGPLHASSRELALFCRDELSARAGHGPKALDAMRTGRFAVTKELLERLKPEPTAGGAGVPKAADETWIKRWQRQLNARADWVCTSTLAALLWGMLDRLGLPSKRRKDYVYNVRTDDCTRLAEYR